MAKKPVCGTGTTVSLRIAKFGDGKVSTGRHLAGAGDEFFAVGAVAQLPRGGAGAGAAWVWRDTGVMDEDALFFPPPFTGEGDRGAVEGAARSAQAARCLLHRDAPSVAPRCAMRDTSPVNGGGKEWVRSGGGRG